MSSARPRSGANACTGTLPSNWITGIRQASIIERQTWPPSRKPMGIMLNAFRRNPRYASARSIDESRWAPIAHTTAAAMPPAAGPANEMSEFRHGDSPACLIFTYAPMSGMNIGADTSRPCRRASTTWPSSWTRIISTKPSANVQL